MFGLGKVLELKEDFADICLYVSAEWWVEPCHFPWPVFFSFFPLISFKMVDSILVSASLEGLVVR